MRVHSLFTNGSMSADDAYLMYVFAWMVVIYGPVQLVRVVFHWRVAGILDQWFTLPIFAWVGVTCYEIGVGRTSNNLDVLSMILIMTLSVTSYGLAILHVRGFEVALGAHICGVVVQGLRVYQRASSDVTELDRQRQLAALIRAVVCCAGFVALKLADWHLVHQLPMPFAVFSGHFWSKIADFMQFHYACQFLEAALAIKLHSKAQPVTSHKSN